MMRLIFLTFALSISLANGVENQSFDESQWADLEFPFTVREFERRGKPFTINVEGIVGTGKSTLLRSFKPLPHFSVLPEPVSKWSNLNGTDLLQLIFEDPKRWAMTQESYVYLTMLEEHLKKSGVAKIMERSLFSARYIFIENLYRSGLIQPVEYSIMSQYFDFLLEVPEFDIETDLTVYLQTSPSTSLERIHRRARKEEVTVDLEFLENIHRLHEDWLLHKNSSFPMPSKKVIVINTDGSYEEMKRIYKSLANKIWSIIPKEIKQKYKSCQLRF